MYLIKKWPVSVNIYFVFLCVYVCECVCTWIYMWLCKWFQNEKSRYFCPEKELIRTSNFLLVESVSYL